jgi:UDP-N-acetylglucosamine 4,6-dehydratase
MSGVLVTGVTGTFGRAFLRAVLGDSRWERVVGYSRDEVKQAGLQQEFGDWGQLRLFLGDVRDPDRLAMALRGVDTVVHAAALKRVDAGAYSPSEMIHTNIVGTMNVVAAAIHAGVARVVVISSDKAVAATNIYGSTKFCAETYAVQANAYGHPTGTKIAAVRYGNVLGSRGSVVHVWREQVARSEPLALTSPEMSRFVMTIEQAVDLVRFALDAMHGGEVVVPILPSAKMVTLARAVGGDAYPHRLVGLRPGGEKMAESLLNEEEPARTYQVGNYYVVTPSHHDWTSGAEWFAPHGFLPGDFVYRSDANTRWLSSDDLRALMAGSEACR